MRVTSALNRISAFKQKCLRKYQRLCTPVSPGQMRKALKDVTGGGTGILLLHASVSNCGRLTAGPQDILKGVAEFCDTLVLPTHSYCYPSAPDEPGPLFDSATTPSVIGLLGEIFRIQPGVVRSIQATHSLAASGPFAQELCSGHYLQGTPCGAGTPYSRLLCQKASVLMFGITFDYYTLFHTAEDAAGSEFAYEHGTVDWLRVVDEHGTVRDCRSRRQNRAPYRFEQAGYLAERAGLVRRVPLGHSYLLYVPDCSAVHAFILEYLRKTPDFLRCSCAQSIDVA